MLSVNNDLSVDEMSSIIKLSATNIDHIRANEPLRGLYGAGSLHTGRAVKMTHEMLQPDSYTLLENQNFTRWNFSLRAPYKVLIRNEQFREAARVDFTAKEEILIDTETVFLPDANGSILLTIDPEATYNLQKNN